MRVVVVGPQGPDLFAENIATCLTRMGHEVMAVGSQPAYDKPISRLGIARRRAEGLVKLVAEHRAPLRARLQAGWLRAILDARPRLVISVDRSLSREVIRAAASAGARTALWFPDAVSSMGRHDMFVNGFDRVYLTNPVLADRLHRIYRLPVAYLPEACNPAWHRPIVPYGTERSVVMAGNIHPTRAALLDRLVADGVPLRIYGAPVPGWVGYPSLSAFHTGEYLARQRKADVFRSARAVLNNLHPAEFAGTNCRLFEGTGSGAVVVTEERPGLGDLFEVGPEVETFDSYDELLSKIRRLLDSPETGKPVADAAARRAHADHTYEQRLTQILHDLGLE